MTPQRVLPAARQCDSDAGWRDRPDTNLHQARGIPQWAGPMVAWQVPICLAHKGADAFVKYLCIHAAIHSPVRSVQHGIILQTIVHHDI